MQLGDRGIALIKEYEQGPKGGFAALPYRCPAGKLTIGWGHVILPSDTLKPPIDAAEAEALLRADLAPLAREVAHALRHRPEVTPSMFDAVMCLGINIGRSALLRSTLMRRLRDGQWQAAADEFLRWDKARDPKTRQLRRLRGLSRRRQAERTLFLQDGIPEEA